MRRELENPELLLILCVLLSRCRLLAVFIVGAKSKLKKCKEPKGLAKRIAGKKTW